MSQRKLLLADDSITIQKVVNLTFADEGIEVITVGDGDSAMEKIAEVKPDLVMADINMPGLNGYQVCEKIRQSETHGKTPVILLVGSFEPFDEAEANRVGASGFLTKPFQSIRQLVSKVTELLEGSSRNGENSETRDFQNADTLNNFAVANNYPAPEHSERFGDTGMDDEMIQANNASGFALDESSKFETREVDESEQQGAAKTQPLSSADLEQFSFQGQPEESAATANKETPYEVSGEENFNEPADEQDYKETEEMSAPQTAPVYETEDDDDLLEIPFDEDEEYWEEETAVETVSQTEAPVETSDSVLAQSAASETEIAQTESESAENTGATETSSHAFIESSTASPQFSQELIDAIVQRVMEKLSDKAVKDVAWEVVPEMADLIIKKMTEEKLKE